MKYKLNKQLSFSNGNPYYYVTKNTFDLNNVLFERLRRQLLVELGIPINGIFSLFDANYSSSSRWSKGTK